MTDLHTKPTQEELDAQIAEAASLETEAEEEKKELDKNIEEQDESIEEVEEEEEEKPVKKVVEIKDEEEEEEPKQPEYKKKFIESSRESQVLAAKLKKQNEALEEATSIPEPTETELKAEYSDWDVMTELEKRMAKKTLHYDRRFAALDKVAKENKDVQSWMGRVDTFVEDPKSLIKHPLLEGKEDEFRLFATKPTRRNVDFDDLVSAFLYEERASRPKNKTKMFPSSSGEKKTSKDTGKLSVEDSKRLMDTNYSEYKRMLLAGKISDQI